MSNVTTHEKVLKIPPLQGGKKSQYTQCRLSSLTYATQAIIHGDWVCISSVGWLQADADDFNEEYRGRISYWLEYQ